MLDDPSAQPPEQDNTPIDTPDSVEESSGFLDGLMGAFEAKPEEAPEADAQPEVKTEEKPTQDQKPEEDPDLADLPKSVSEKTKVGWKELKTAKRTIEEERDKLKAELETLRTQPKTEANNAEIEKIKQELETYRTKATEYEQRMALVDVTQTEEYQTTIGKPLEQAEHLIGEYAKEYQLNVADIAAAAMQDNPLARNKALAEMTSSMDTYNQQEFHKLVTSARDLYLRSEQAKSKASETLKYIESQRQQKAEEAKQYSLKQREEASTKVWGGLEANLGFLKDLPEKDKILADARSADIANSPPDVQAYAAYAAVLLPTMKNQMEAQAKKIAELEASIAKRSGASPKVSNGGAQIETSDSDESFEDGFQKLFPGR